MGNGQANHRKANVIAEPALEGIGGSRGAAEGGKAVVGKFGFELCIGEKGGGRVWKQLAQERQGEQGPVKFLHIKQAAVAEQARTLGNGVAPFRHVVEDAGAEDRVVSMSGQRHFGGIGDGESDRDGEGGKALAGAGYLGGVEVDAGEADRVGVGGEVGEFPAIAAAEAEDMRLLWERGDALEQAELQRPLHKVAERTIHVKAFEIVEFHCTGPVLSRRIRARNWSVHGGAMIKRWKVLGLAATMAGLMVMTGELSVHAATVSKDTSATMADNGVGYDTSKIEELTTPKGLTVWLIRAPNLPMVNVELNFRAGSEFEPEAKRGVAQFTAALMDEGAGAYDAREFREELEKIGARYGASTDTQDVSVNLTTLTEHKERAFDLLGLAVMQPRFDTDAVVRMRDALLADIRQGDEEPGQVAWRLFRPAIYGSHPYANSGEGTLETVGSLNAEDARAWHGRFTKKNLKIAVVGDITPDELAKLLDKALGDLPEGEVRAAVTVAPSATIPAIMKAEMDVPQGTVLLGHLGMPRTDPDFYAMLVMNEILGGGVMTSRLGADVREKHGLAYGVNSVNAPLPYNGMFYVSLATGNDTVAKALELVRKHLRGIREAEVTQEEFDDAKAYLIGSFPLRLDSNAKLMNMLAMMQSEDLAKDYLKDWPQRIGAVTKADILRVAQRLIQPDAMALVIVGQGKALEAQ